MKMRTVQVRKLPLYLELNAPAMISSVAVAFSTIEGLRHRLGLRWDDPAVKEGLDALASIRDCVDFLERVRLEDAEQRRAE